MSKQYSIISCNAELGVITVQFNPCVIVLPIDENGNVPTGDALESLINSCVPAYNEFASPKDPTTVINNFSEIESIVAVPTTNGKNMITRHESFSDYTPSNVKVWF